jgi:pilus assembly protein CpaE
MPESGQTIRVMIVDDIAETREQLRKLLSFDPDIEVVAMVRSGEDAIQNATDIKPDVVLMDVNLPGIDGIAATSKLLEVVPSAQVLMLSVQGESDYMRRAMMAGARDYLTKPPSADELLDAIHRIVKLRPAMRSSMPDTSARSRSQVDVEQGKDRDLGGHNGEIITVFSPKGGTGCTSITVNTAVSIQKKVGNDAKAALVDANLQFGDVAIFLKMQPTRTLTDIAPHMEDLDAELLQAVMVPHPSGLKVLAAPAKPEEAELMREGGVDEMGENRRMRQLLDFMRQHFDYILVDAAHTVDDVTLALLDMSDVLLVVTRPIIPEIRGARLFLELLQKLEYDMQKVKLVINSVDNKRMGIQPEAIERAMMPSLVKIPLDEKTALRAANYGVPFVLKDARAEISEAIETLATELLAIFRPEEEDVQPVEETSRRSGLGRLLG